MSQNDGGPAFPTITRRDRREPGWKGEGDEVHEYKGEPGITVRDYFAIRAPEFIPEWFRRAWEDEQATLARQEGAKLDQPIHLMTRWSYAWADAMLAERSKESK